MSSCTHSFDIHLALAGFITLGPDYFFGDPIQNHDDDPDFDMAAWLAKAKAQADKTVPKWLESVKAKLGEHSLDLLYVNINITAGTTATKYFAVGKYYFKTTVYKPLNTSWLPGYCFGAPYVMNLGATGFIRAGK